jgi:hypothetical protein
MRRVYGVRMTETEAACYLAAMIDGEGHIRVHRNRSASVANTERDLIDAVTECCDVLGLHYVVNENSYHREGDGYHRKPIWEVRMAGKDTLERIRDVVPLRSKRKAQAVRDAIAAYTQKPRPPREWLEQKYLVERLSLQQCAEAWGVRNSASAHSWMQYYGIPRREVGGGSGRKYPLPDREWLQARVNEGLTLKQIGDLTGAPVQAAWRWCRHHRIERPEEHGHG